MASASSSSATQRDERVQAVESQAGRDRLAVHYGAYLPVLLKSHLDHGFRASSLSFSAPAGALGLDDALPFPTW